MKVVGGGIHVKRFNDVHNNNSSHFNRAKYYVINNSYLITIMLITTVKHTNTQDNIS